MHASPPASFIVTISLESDALAIFQRHRRDVYGWAVRVLGDHHDALDVTQEVFLKWVEQMGVVPPANPRAWLRTVTTNRAIDVVRSRRRDGRGAEPAPRTARDSDNRPERAELRDQINSALASLSDQQHSVLIAKVYDGLTFAAIAEELDIAVPTVKTHYLRALAAVRERLPEDLNPKGMEP